MKKNQIILTVLVSIIALGTIGVGASLAWYLNSNNLYVDAIDIKIKSDSELKISTSTDLSTFVTELDFSNNRNNDYKPVTSAYSSAWMENHNPLPTFYDDTANYGRENNGSVKEEAASGYFTQRLYLYSDDDVDVIIDPNKTSLKANALFNNEHARNLYNHVHGVAEKDVPYEYRSLIGKSVAEIEDELNRLVYAMRYSILVPGENYQYGIIDPNKDANKVVEYGGLLDLDIDQCYDYFAKDGQQYEQLYGDINNPDCVRYSPGQSEDSDELAEYDAFKAKHKANVNRLDLNASREAGLVINQEKSFSLDDFKGNEVKPFFIRLNANEVQEIVLSIYIEGWDLESVNYTMGATFDADIAFKVDRPHN